MGFDTMDGIIAAANAGANIANAKNTAAIQEATVENARRLNAIYSEIQRQGNELQRQAVEKAEQENANLFILKNDRDWASFSMELRCGNGAYLAAMLRTGRWQEQWFAKDKVTFDAYSRLLASGQQALDHCVGTYGVPICTGVQLGAFFDAAGILPYCLTRVYAHWGKKIQELTAELQTCRDILFREVPKVSAPVAPEENGCGMSILIAAGLSFLFCVTMTIHDGGIGHGNVIISLLQILLVWALFAIAAILPVYLVVWLPMRIIRKPIREMRRRAQQEEYDRMLEAARQKESEIRATLPADMLAMMVETESSLKQIASTVEERTKAIAGVSPENVGTWKAVCATIVKEYGLSEVGEDFDGIAQFVDRAYAQMNLCNALGMPVHESIVSGCEAATKAISELKSKYGALLGS